LSLKKKSIWLLSAYRSDSHASWVDWLRDQFSDGIRWTVVELPGRYFRWRIRGNPLSWLNALPDETPDLILATSMVDIATLKGLHPRLAQVPIYYYFHENQFAYPVSTSQDGSIDPMMVQLYGALASDRLLFNSAYNRDSFLNGIDELLDRLPDHVPQNVVPLLRQRCNVLPVVVKPVLPLQENGKLILWNHRWEYDKAPEVFADALSILDDNGVEFELALLGGRHQNSIPMLEEIARRYTVRIRINDKVSRAEYENWLGQADIVVSSAIHEFQGLSVIEAVSAGAVPVVPDALCYREQYADIYRYPAGDAAALAERLQAFLHDKPAVPDVSSFTGETLKERWQQLLLSD
jgi:glycosyltransferase involved in cell wall biosynthesis